MPANTMQRFLAMLGLMLAGPWLQAAPDAGLEVPTPELMQAQVWALMELQDFRLEGFMRTGKNLHPILLRTKGRRMVYEFLEKPLQIRVTMEGGNGLIERRASSQDKWSEVKGSSRLETILDSDLAYEDLGLDFLRWGNVKPLGEDSIKTLKAWAYEAKPYGASNYSKARYWISADYLAVLRVDAFNDKDQAVKRVEMNGVLKVGQNYVIKEMQISSLVPGRELSKSKTYIEIRNAYPGSGL
jgi:hypothetical protein